MPAAFNQVAIYSVKWKATQSPFLPKPANPQRKAAATKLVSKHDASTRKRAPSH